MNKIITVLKPANSLFESKPLPVPPLFLPIIKKSLPSTNVSLPFVAVEGEKINTDWMQHKLLHSLLQAMRIIAGGYFEESNRGQLIAIRTAYPELGFDEASKGPKKRSPASFT